MIKLKVNNNSDKEVKIDERMCEFCGEYKKCFRGTIPYDTQCRDYELHYDCIAVLDTHKHYKHTFFGGWKYIIPEKEKTYRYISSGNTDTVKRIETYSVICEDCVSQLSKIKI